MSISSTNSSQLELLVNDEDTNSSEKKTSQLYSVLQKVNMTNVLGFICFSVIVTVVYTLSVSDSRQQFFVESGVKHWIRKSWAKNVDSGYICEEGQCVKRYFSKNESLLSLASCNMLCSTLPLWPRPKQIQINNRNASVFNPGHISIRTLAPVEVKNDLIQISNIFLKNLPTSENFYMEQDGISNMSITITVEKNVVKPKLNVNEQYYLSVLNMDENIWVNVTAQTYIGAFYALETLSQLIWIDHISEKYEALSILHDVIIEDYPAFSHRGMMIDTARNFFPVQQLLRVIDGMAASKLNVLHLHLTDAVSFPIVLPNNPEFAENGAYSSEMVYKIEDITNLIEYARIRGIRVVLEIDTPSHVNEGWNRVTTSNGNLVICGDQDVFNGHLNPDNNDTLEVLQSIYEDLLNLGTDNQYFHIGGDEVNTTCYQHTESVKKFDDVMYFLSNYTELVIEKVKLANRNKLPDNIVLWSSPLTDRGYTDLLKYKKNVVIQFWLGQYDTLLTKGYKIVFSTVGEWYLDCGFGPWQPSHSEGSCNPYTTWQTFYKYRPWVGYPQYRQNILGGEVCLWTEMISSEALEVKIWPRTAAFAERVWSDPEVYDARDVFYRLSNHRERLISRGIRNEAMWPRWCIQNPGKC